MPLFDLLNDFRKSPAALSKWMYAHQQHHKLILNGLKTKGITQTTEYVLYPFPEKNQLGWMLHNQQMHNEFNAALNLNGTDMQSVDLKDEQDFKTFLWDHYNEHRSASLALGI